MARALAYIHSKSELAQPGDPSSSPQKERIGQTCREAPVGVNSGRELQVVQAPVLWFFVFCLLVFVTFFACYQMCVMV